MKINLSELVHYHDYQISSRSLSQKLGLDLPLTIYAMAKGESISNESSPHTKLIQILEGNLEVTLEGEESLTLQEKDLLSIDAGQVHHIYASEKCQFLQMEV